MKKKFINLISFFLVLSFLVICFVYYNSNTFVKNIDKNLVDIIGLSGFVTVCGSEYNG